MEGEVDYRRSMSKSENRQTEKQVLVRMSEEDYKKIEDAIGEALKFGPGFLTTSLPRFIRIAALEKAEAILKEAKASKKK